MGFLQRLVKLFDGGGDAGAGAELKRVRALQFALTSAGRRELDSNAHQLDTHLRALLKLADGRRDGMQLLAATESLGADELSLLKLYAWGYVETTSEDENQYLAHLTATMGGMKAPGPANPTVPVDLARPLLFRVFNAEDMAEEAARLDNAIQRRNQAATTQQRNRIEVEGLNAFGIKMLAGLHSRGIVLPHLEAGYPNLVNRLALTFGQPREFLSMIDSLMLDTRGGREGFTADVLRDLDALKSGFIQHFVPLAERAALLEDWTRPH